MKRMIFPCVAMLLSAVAGCGNSDKCANVMCATGQSCNADTGVCENPAVPSLGAVIDRMGRPAVNTALTNPFDFYNNEPADTTKDRYNADGNPQGWLANWTAAIQSELGIYDALDDTCKNQAGYIFANSYGTLAAVLAGDALQVDTGKTTCNQYLGAELAGLGLPITDCGGRKLNYDVIDVTYSALATGGLSGVTDGINASSANPATTFPFMVNPL